MTQTELRCPVARGRGVMAKVSRGEATILVDNVIEIACDNCRKVQRQMGKSCSLVVHRFNVLGECLETDVRP